MFYAKLNTGTMYSLALKRKVDYNFYFAKWCTLVGIEMI